ncbi:hypothetical protein E4U47_001204 [Claviceps purpurea]|nr:hypothetical protein E4U47_001204 [Claviceps purpurea]
MGSIAGPEEPCATASYAPPLYAPPPLHAPQRRILFLDAYDSFTNNVVSLLKDALGSKVRVHVLHMDLRTLDDDPSPDWTPEQFLRRLPDFDAVVCGPGPGSPLHDADVGAFKLLWQLPHEQSVPVLGICLGFQSLVEHFGGGICRLQRGGLHGMVRTIDHVQPHRPSEADIFDSVAPFKATLYHSLCADIGQHEIPDCDWHDKRWESPAMAPDLVPLAWALDCEEVTEVGDEKKETEGSSAPERILMAVRHATRPFWGVQYHPESVCTDSHGAQGVIRNWFHRALQWNETERAGGVRKLPSVDHVDSLAPGLRTSAASCPWWPDMQSGLARRGLNPSYSCRQIKLPVGVDTADVAEVLGLGATDTIILDSSSTTLGDPLARHSILAIDVQHALRLEYHVGDDHVLLRQPATSTRREECQTVRLAGDGGLPVDPWSPWHVLSEYWAGRRVPQEGGDGSTPSTPSSSSSSPPSPSAVFKGGFMGFVTYEMGLSTLSPGSVAGARGHHRPDLCMAWVSKSIVLDHQAGIAYVQSLTTAEDPDDASWLDDTVDTIQSSHAWRNPGCGNTSTQHDDTSTPKRSNEALLESVSRPKGSTQGKLERGRVQVSVPESSSYEADVRTCQEYIRRGDTYELCLTAQTTMTRPRGQDQPHHTRSSTTTTTTSTTSTTSSSQDHPPHRKHLGASPTQQDPSPHHGTPWQIYRALRTKQPAPFGSFTRLSGATLISCSPERFLSHDRHGLCAMRPMKGTVRKSPTCSTLAQAEKVLHVPKEEAENLMIVDLVRHDLYGVCGAQSVSVPQLLHVEEYATVFQMVTAVQGQLPMQKLAAAGTAPATGGAAAATAGDCASALPFTGMHVLASCLPPGSMTGAPKKRSCEILQTIEPGERSIYSGVVGYLDVQGQGDWSVTIRTMFRWDDERCAGEDGDGNGDGEGEQQDGEREVWRIGAGGAVTTLSTEVGEREEMFTKLCGPLGTFVDVA